MVRQRLFEQINRLLLEQAKRRRVEKGRKERVDATVVETSIHAPADSSLLHDRVRVLTRLAEEAKERCGFALWSDHTRRAKRQVLAVQRAHGRQATRCVPGSAEGGAEDGRLWGGGSGGTRWYGGGGSREAERGGGRGGAVALERWRCGSGRGSTRRSAGCGRNVLDTGAKLRGHEQRGHHGRDIVAIGCLRSALTPSSARCRH
jgi:hypothetical protein